MHFRMGPLAFAGLLLVGCAAAPAAVSGPQLTAADDETLYNTRFDDLLRSGGELSGYSPVERVPGAAFQPLPLVVRPKIATAALDAASSYARANNSNALIVWRDGKIERADYFGATTPTTPIVSKSLAKPVSAIAIGRALALGKIKSLDQPVADFIPEWTGTPKGAMRVRHLLDMRSGLLAEGFSTNRDNPWSRAYLDPDHGRYIIQRYPLTDPPGTRYEYSNATADLVALVIERATARRYAEFVGNEILQPIGAAGGSVYINRPDGLAHSGCCMMLPAESWLRLGKLLLDDGMSGGRRLWPAGYVAEMRRPTAQNLHYGLGVWVAGHYAERRGFANPARPLPKVLHSAPYAASDLFLFDGNSNQVVYIVPSQRLIVLRTGGNPPKSPEWDNSFLPNTLIGGIIRAPDSPTPERQRR